MWVASAIYFDLHIPCNKSIDFNKRIFKQRKKIESILVSTIAFYFYSECMIKEVGLIMLFIMENILQKNGIRFMINIQKRFCEFNNNLWEALI